uniref:Interferon regulatory factor n=1 Tax=Gouania willdenowi TaxID=441366 RepID=A0A8C5E477_GOUWI
MPVERMRMRPWLEEQIYSNQIPGLKWVNREKRIFQIPWMHAARHGWDLEKDAPLFMRWAIHTGKYQPGVDRPDPKTWKANFRCAMNSLPDIEEVKDRSIKKGTNAFRVYKMLSFAERSAKKGKKRTDKDGKAPAHTEVYSSPAGAWPSPTSEASDDIKQETIKEETFEVTLTDGEANQCTEDHPLITSEQLPFVCQTVEVTTESEEQLVSSSHSYPLQISPVSSYCDEDSGAEENKEVRLLHVRGGVLSSYSRSVLRIPPCSLPSMASFVCPTNLRVTSLRDPAPLISYHSPQWTQHCPTPTSSSPTPETRASVIMKTSDVTSS